MGTGIVRHEKVTSTSGMYACEMHNRRYTVQHSNKDIDPALSHRNVCLLRAEGSYTEAFERLIAAEYTGTRKIRKDAVRMVETLYTASPEFFEGLDDEQTIRYFQACLAFAQKESGGHVVEAVVHMDEQTPHMHLVWVPLDSQGKLRWKSFFPAIEALQRFQDRFHREVAAHWGLERGERRDLASDARPLKRHKSTAALKAETAREQEAAEQKLAVTKQAVKEETAALREARSEREQAQEAVQALTAAAEAAEERAEATRSALEGLEEQLKDKAAELDEHVEALAVAQDRLERVRHLAVDVERASTEVRDLAAQAAERGAAGGGWAERCSALTERVRGLAEHLRATIQALGEAFEQIRLLIPVPEPDDRIGRARKTATVVNGRVMYSTPKPVGKRVERKHEPTINQLGKQAQQSIEAQRQDGIGRRGRGGRSGPER